MHCFAVQWGAVYLLKGWRAGCSRRSSHGRANKATAFPFILDKPCSLHTWASQCAVHAEGFRLRLGLVMHPTQQWSSQGCIVSERKCVFSFSVSLTQAYPKLAPYRPPGQLISPPLLLSVILHTGITTVMLVCGFLFVKQQPWYSEMANHR